MTDMTDEERRAHKREQQKQNYRLPQSVRARQRQREEIHQRRRDILIRITMDFHPMRGRTDNDQ